ncbi:thioredoxin domain-containing protein 5-like [Babylonia areolata]|uniref:thioredoxin domain-containing protein 5-like n=1 Tax=Babylonia areolata TaxID=304850 RepID=UPI003FD27AEA
MAAHTANVVCLAFLFVLVSVSFADNDDHGSDAVSYDKDTFQSAIGEKKHFVMFFAPWCGHCKRLAPTWNELAKVFNNDESSVTVAKVDCTMETALCSEHDVTGYPTLKFFHQKADDFQRYKGNRDLDSLKKFVEEQASRTEEEGDKPQTPEEDEAAAAPVELTDETFEESIQEGFHFVKFYAPWCGHCKRLAPTWEQLAKSFAGNSQVSVDKVDCTVSTKLCTDQGVRGYPTLILFNNGDKVDQYQGSRSHEDLKAFVSRKVSEASGSQEEKVTEEEEEEEEKEDLVVDLTDETFEEAISEGVTFVKFFAPWCGHCKRLAPTWTELGQSNEDKEVTIARVDCTQHQSVCNSQSIRGYPTLAIFRNGQRVNDYKGQRDLESLQEFVDSFLEHTEL